VALLEVAELIAEDLRGRLQRIQEPRTTPPASEPERPRVLLVEDRDLTARDWPYAHVLGDLERHARSLAQQVVLVLDAIEAVEALDTDDNPTEVPADDGPVVIVPGDGLRRFIDRPDQPTLPITERLAAYTASAADVLGLLRTDYTVTSSTTDAKSSTLTAAVAAALAEPGVDVLVEGFHLVQPDGPVHAALDCTLEADATLAVVQARLQRRLSALADEGAPQVVRARDRDAEATAVRGAWAAALTSLTTAPADGPPPLAAAALRAAVRDVRTGITHVVHLSLDSSGTDVVTQRSLFGPSGRLRLVGGVTLSWLLVGAGGGELAGAGSRYQGWSTEYDLKTGHFSGAAIPAFTNVGGRAQAETGTRAQAATVEPTPPPLKPSWASSDVPSRLVVLGLALAGTAWLVMDGISRLVG
jgi:hypothetical protein